MKMGNLLMQPFWPGRGVSQEKWDKAFGKVNKPKINPESIDTVNNDDYMSSVTRQLEVQERARAKVRNNNNG